MRGTPPTLSATIFSLIQAPPPWGDRVYHHANQSSYNTTSHSLTCTQRNNNKESITIGLSLSFFCHVASSGHSVSSSEAAAAVGMKAWTRVWKQAGSGNNPWHLKHEESGQQLLEVLVHQQKQQQVHPVRNIAKDNWDHK